MVGVVVVVVVGEGGLVVLGVWVLVVGVGVVFGYGLVFGVGGGRV